MKQIQDFLAFVKKNKYFLFIILGIIILLQVLSLGSRPSVTQNTDPRTEKQMNQTEWSFEQPENRDVTPPVQNTNKNDFTSIIILAILVLVFVLAKKYGYLEKLFPSIFIFRTTYFKQKSTGNLVVKVWLINKTKSDISLNNPTVSFFKGSKKREFTIKNIGGQNYFPLTLMPNTGHKFVIDIQKFYNNIDDLKEYKNIQMKICATSGKCYKSTKWPASLTFRTIK